MMEVGSAGKSSRGRTNYTPYLKCQGLDRIERSETGGTASLNARLEISSYFMAGI